MHLTEKQPVSPDSVQHGNASHNSGYGKLETNNRTRTNNNAPETRLRTHSQMKDSRNSLVFHCMLDALDHRALPFRANLLRALEGDERQLEIMRSLLQ